MVNPHAGSKRLRRWNAARLRRKFGSRAQVVETATLNELPQALNELRAAGVTSLVPFGGDGTLSQVLSTAIQVWGDDLPDFMALRGGTMNMVASHLGMPREDPARVLAAMLRKPGKTQPKARRAMLSDQGYAGFTFGFGAPVRFLQQYDAGGVRGAIGLIARASMSLGKYDGVAARLFEPLTVTLVGTRDPIEQSRLRLFLAMTIDELPLGFKVAPGAGEDGQNMHLIYGNVPPAFVVRNLHRFHSGRLVSGPNLTREQDTMLDFTFDQDTAWMMDGEIYAPCRRLRLELGPMVDFIVPNR